MSSDDVFHSRLNRSLAIVVWAVCGAVIIGAAVGTGAESWRAIPFATLAAFAAWLALWHPAVVVGDGAVTIVNVSHSVVIPWAAVIDVDTKYALSVRTPARAYTAFAAPAPGRLGSRAALRRERRSADGEESDPFRPDRPGARTSDLPSTDSGAAAALVRRRWQRLLDDGRIEIGAADRSRAILRVHLPALMVTIVLLAACVIAVYG